MGRVRREELIPCTPSNFIEAQGSPWNGEIKSRTSWKGSVLQKILAKTLREKEIGKRSKFWKKAS